MKIGYQETEAGVIPAEWQAVRLEAFGHTYGGLTGKTKADFGTGQSLYVTFLDVMTNVVIDGSCVERVRIKAGESQSLVYCGDLLFTGSSETPDEVAMCALVTAERQSLYLNSFCFGYRIERADLVDGRFLAYLLRSAVGRKAVAPLAQGSTRYNISKRAVLRTHLPLPPMAEQRAIAAALSDVDSLLEALDRLIAKKRDLKRATMQQLLTGKTRLPGFHAAWEVKRLGEIGEFFKGSGVKKDQSQSGDIPCVRYGELYTHHHDYIRSFNSWLSREVAMTATPLRTGDILFAGSGETKEEIGKCVAFIGTGEAFAGGDIVILRPKQSVPAFLGYVLNTPEVSLQKASRGQGDAVVHISASALSSIVLRLPSDVEQAAIFQVLQDMDLEISGLVARRNKTHDTKTAMMQELLTGKTRLVAKESRHA